jgi:hypothetical protein
MIPDLGSEFRNIGVLSLHLSIPVLIYSTYVLYTLILAYSLKKYTVFSTASRQVLINLVAVDIRYNDAVQRLTNTGLTVYFPLYIMCVR